MPRFLHRRRRRPSNRGITMLEMMIVIAIIGAGMFVLRGAYRSLTKADLVEDANELATVMRRTAQLAIERGEQHRVVFDLDKQKYVIEVCQGQAAIMRNEKLRNDEEDTKRAVERGQERLRDLPADALAVGDPEEALKRAMSISGHHVADRTCVPVEGGFSGDAGGKGLSGKTDANDKELKQWERELRAANGIKFKEIWVQHLDDSTTKGQVAVYFFPGGSAEKAVIEVTDSTDTYTVYVHGLTGRVQLKDGKLDDVDAHMLRNVMGDRDAKREEQR